MELTRRTMEVRLHRAAGLPVPAWLRVIESSGATSLQLCFENPAAPRSSCVGTILRCGRPCKEAVTIPLSRLVGLVTLTPTRCNSRALKYLRREDQEPLHSFMTLLLRDKAPEGGDEGADDLADQLDRCVGSVGRVKDDLSLKELEVQFGLYHVLMGNESEDREEVLRESLSLCIEFGDEEDRYAVVQRIRDLLSATIREVGASSPRSILVASSSKASSTAVKELSSERPLGGSDPLVTASGRSILRGGDDWAGWMWRVVYGKWADLVVLLVIIANIGGLAASQPWDRSDAGLEALETACSVFYTIELLLKVFALGGFAPYLSDGWQILDAFIVAGGWISDIPQYVMIATGDTGGSKVQLSALRGLRALRALRTVQFLSGVRELLATLGSTTKVVVQVLVVNLLVLVGFAAFGSDAFGPALSKQCVAPPLTSVPPSLASELHLADAPSWPSLWPSVSESLGYPRQARASMPVTFCTTATYPAPLNATELAWKSIAATHEASTVVYPLNVLGTTQPASLGECPPLHQCVAQNPPHGGLSTFTSPMAALLMVARVGMRAPNSQMLVTGIVQSVSPVTILYFICLALTFSFGFVGLFVAIVRSTFVEILNRNERLKLRMKELRRIFTERTIASTQHVAQILRVSSSESSVVLLEGGDDDGVTPTAADSVAPWPGRSDTDDPPTASSVAVATSSVVVEVGTDEASAPTVEVGTDEASAPTVEVGTDEASAPTVEVGTDEASAPTAAASSGGAPLSTGSHAVLRAIGIRGPLGRNKVTDRAIAQIQAGTTSSNEWLWEKKATSSAAPTTPALSRASSAAFDPSVREAPPPLPPYPWSLPTSRVCCICPRDSCFVMRVRSIVLTAPFDRAVMMVILANTIGLASSYAGMSFEYAVGLEVAELVFTALFTLEMIMKIVALGGVYHYVIATGTGWNRFDAFVVSVTILDLAMTLASGSSPLDPSGPFRNPDTGGLGPDMSVQRSGSGVGINLSMLRIFRIVRVLRIVRLLRSFPELSRLVGVIASSLKDLGSWVAVTLVMLTTFSIAGMQLFGGALAHRPRGHFDSFGDAIITLMRMMNGGATWAVVQDIVSAPAGQAGIPGYIGGSLFFLLFLVIMQFQLLNFLTALILAKFALKPEEKAVKLRERHRLMAETIAPTHSALNALVENLVDGVKQPLSLAQGKSLRSLFLSRKTSAASSFIMMRKHKPADAIDDAGDSSCLSSTINSIQSFVNAQDEDESSLWVFGLENRFRGWMVRIASSQWFETVIMSCIILSSIALALDSPALQSDATASNVLMVLDLVFLVVFWAEFVVKVVAFGLLFGERSYFRGGDASWNWLDFIVLVLSSVSFGSGGGGAAKVGRLGRVLRPLRAVRRNPAMRIVINALLKALPAVYWTVVLLLCLFLVWAILGISLFAGKFNLCTDASVSDMFSCSGWFRASPTTGTTTSAASGFLRSPTLLLPRVWYVPRTNFDSVFGAVKTLFETFTLRNWVPVLSAVMDAREMNQQPVRDSNPFASIFILVFVWVAAVYMGRLFVGAIVGSFRQFSGTALLSPDQSHAAIVRKILGSARTTPSLSESLSWYIVRVARSWMSRWFVPFEACAALAGFAHVITAFDLATRTASLLVEASSERAPSFVQVQTLRTQALWVHGAFVIWYLLEFGIRVVVAGSLSRLSRRVGLPEVAVGVSLLILCITVPAATGWTYGTGVARGMFAVIRMLTRGRVADALGLREFRKVIAVIAEAIPALVNISALLILFLFTWAVLGTQLFGSVRFGGALQPMSSFRDFPSSLFTMFQMITGSDWTSLMADCAVEPPRCSLDTGDCGSNEASTAYFFIYHLMFGAVFSNLYTAAILDKYNAASLRLQSEEALGFEVDGKQDAKVSAPLRRFAIQWSVIDEHQTEWITMDQLRPLMLSLAREGHPFMEGVKVTSSTVSFVAALTLSRQQSPQVAVDALLHGDSEGRTRLRFRHVLQSLSDLQLDSGKLEPHEQDLFEALARAAVALSAVSVIRKWVNRRV
jgi:hypothetical protein